MSRTRNLMFISVVVLAFGVSTAFANRVDNGSFQTGDLTGWTLTGPGPNFVTGPFDGYTSQDASDPFFFAIGAIGGDMSLSQTITDAPGVNYTLSFYYAANGTGFSDFSAFYDGTQLLALGNPTDTGSAYVHYSFVVTGTGSDTIQFFGRNDPSFDALDNVSATSVPEPASLLLLGAGLLGLGGMIRRFRS